VIEHLLVDLVKHYLKKIINCQTFLWSLVYLGMKRWQ